MFHFRIKRADQSDILSLNKCHVSQIFCIETSPSLRDKQILVSHWDSFTKTLFDSWEFKRGTIQKRGTVIKTVFMPRTMTENIIKSLFDRDNKNNRLFTLTYLLEPS